MSKTFAATRRVVVTGMGGITPIGNTLKESWEALCQQKSGMTSLEEALQHQQLPADLLERELKIARLLPCQVAAPVKWDKPYDNRTPRFVQFALQAAKEALEQANLLTWLKEDEVRRYRTGVCVGSGMSGVREIREATHTVETLGIRKLGPRFVPNVLVNTAAGRVSLEYQLQGPNHSASTACAAGAHAIGDAMRCIQYNNADIMLAGGAEACLDPLSMAGFCRLRALSTGFPPSEASRPFDRLRDGFVMGEGSAILVLEERDHALQRGATILAELGGYGLTGDAHHGTAPDPQGRGALRCMKMAMEQAQVDSTKIGYVNAHATSTPKGDEIEARIIDQTIHQEKQRETDLFVSSTKGSTGHLLGAAGAIEAAITVLSLQKQMIPPTLNLKDAEEPVGFHHVTETTETHGELLAALTNSFGFGGTNASLLFLRHTH